MSDYRHQGLERDIERQRKSWAKTTDHEDEPDELMGDLEDDFKHNARTPAEATTEALKARVEDLEQLVKELVAQKGSVSPSRQGEGVLAKAVAGFNDPDALLAYADTVVSDVTTMGIISGFVAAGDLRSAKTALLEVADKTAFAKAAGTVEQVVGAPDSDLADFDTHVAVSELTARFSRMERVLANLEIRLGAVESAQTRSRTAQPDAGQNVAKAVSGSKTTKRRTIEQIKAELLHGIDAYIASPTAVGALTSRLEAGEFDAVTQAVEAAKRSHEAERLKAERRSWS